MFYTERKLERRVDELCKYRYRNVISLTELYVKEDRQGVVNPDVPTVFEHWDRMKVGETWEGRDLYIWLHKDILVPAEWKNEKVLGIFDYGNTGAGNNSGFESLLYIDGKPFQGVDVNHQEVFFGDDVAGKTVSLTFRLWSGLEGGGVPRAQEHKINRADIACLDEKTDDLYYVSLMLIDTLKNLDDKDPIKHELKIHFDNAFKKIDWSYPGSEEFYQSVYDADEYLNEKMESMDKNSLVNVKCVGHTHIDVAWLWRLKHTREKVSRSFSTVLRLMEQYPEYIFLQTQPQLYEYIKEDFPEIYDQIKEKVAHGKWEVDGAMWVEADCNLTSGESLTRQILLGSRFIKEEFGKDVEYLWLPDVFGYSWALPQILKKSGIDMFMTTKISWNQYNRMPHDTFYWRGIDGSEVLTHFITTPDPWSEPGSWFYTYNGKLTPKTVKGVWDAYSDKDLNQELLISYGYGDGGGGVNRDMLEQRRRIPKIPGLPNLETSTAKDYFSNLKKTVENSDQYVHTWDGELYMEYHRGTYTSHAYNKKMNRKMEFLYRETEWLTAMAALQTKGIHTANQEKLTKGWKILLTNQFHDIIPGSSIKEVYDDCVLDYEKAEMIANDVKEEALHVLISSFKNTYTVINNSGWLRSEIVRIPFDGRKGFFTDENGQVLQSQWSENSWYVYVENVPYMGFANVIFKEGEVSKPEEVFTINKNHIETPYYSIDLNEFGQIISIYDKIAERNVIAEGVRANVLQMFEDKPMDNDAWDIDIYYQEKMREVNNLVSIEVKEVGTLKAVIAMEWKYMNTTIKQNMIVYANNRRIDFETYVDYHERQQLLKAAFPVDIRATYATYDVQYGNVERPNHWNTSWDQAKFETVAQKWVDLSEYNYGVSLLNDCKYGHDIKGNVVRITLIKAAIHPDHLQDQGEHHFTYSLLPHQGGFVEGQTVKEAFALNQEMTVIPGICNMANKSFLSIDSEYVEIDAVKQSEDKKYLVVRFHEYTGSKHRIKVNLGFRIQEWMEADLMERPIEPAHADERIELTIKPYEIKTLLIQC
jgi:alpha-mannosidase